MARDQVGTNGSFSARVCIGLATPHKLSAKLAASEDHWRLPVAAPQASFTKSLEQPSGIPS